MLWTLADHQGTVRDVVEYDTATDATVVRNHITYDAFGQITSQTDADYQPRFTFTSRDFDPETGLHYYRARYYDAWMGQFLSEDPIGFEAGDFNYRRYVGNDPLNWVDPTGMDVNLYTAGDGGYGVGPETHRIAIQKEIYPGTILTARAKNLPTLLLEEVQKKSIRISLQKGGGHKYNPWTDTIYLPKGGLYVDMVLENGRAGRVVDKQWNIGIIYNEFFHAYADWYIEESEEAAWLREVMQSQKWAHCFYSFDMSEEAMSELTNAVIDALDDGDMLPTFDQAMRKTKYFDPKTQRGRSPFTDESLVPGHAYKFGGGIFGNQLHGRPMDETLYYATVWVIHNGTKSPVKSGLADKNRITYELKKWFAEEFRPGWTPRQVDLFAKTRLWTK